MGNTIEIWNWIGMVITMILQKKKKYNDKKTKQIANTPIAVEMIGQFLLDNFQGSFTWLTKISEGCLEQRHERGR